MRAVARQPRLIEQVLAERERPPGCRDTWFDGSRTGGGGQGPCWAIRPDLLLRPVEQLSARGTLRAATAASASNAAPSSHRIT